MSLNTVLETLAIAVGFGLGAALVDVGAKYRIQLIYSATHPGKMSPNFKISPSLRHIVLGIIVVISTFMFVENIRNSDILIYTLLIMISVYGTILYRDAVRQLRR